MNSTTSALFEAELRTQVASAEAGLLESLTADDPILIESARGHLDGLLDLAQRNGLHIETTMPAEPAIEQPAVIDTPVILT
ncbi:MAG TPA: hypothetical protein VHV79_03115 [Mycobacteriales bacterium]|jgi:hypothetical protein|nr:hypothetical protein [Mycobacteriales bacterium]